ncbi:MAG: flagellar motor protein MotA [Alphaproteobacteria bacterium]|nr:flagellar motor protein MotA [Alphaproteobacteria bacterium]
MAQPVRYLTRMLVFVGIVGCVAAVLQKPLMQAFMSNPFLNGVILGVLFIGILHNLGQAMRLWPEVRWVNAFRRADPGSNPANLGMPNLLAPMAMLLAERIGPITLSTAATRSILDSVDSRLEESRDISRYLVGLMVFLGLLGTFWGLMITVGSVGDVVKSLDTGADPNAAFNDLRHGIQAPLAGMGTAFSSSLFGLSGSLILGFLDLQATQAQNRFYNKLEEWLSTVTRLGAATPAEGEGGGVPQYVGALLEQTAESLDELQRTLIRSEDRRSAVEQAVLQLSQRLTTLSDQMQTETKLMLRLAEGQLEIKPLLERLARVLEAGQDSDTATTHLRNIDVSLRRLVEETTEGRLQLVSEIRNELKLLSKTVAAVSEGRR